MKTKDTVTTADVAKRAGLSKMTVSRVLNDHPYVSDDTRKKVMQSVKELGFIPNTLAKRFFTGKTQLVGLLMPVEYMFTSYYFKDLFRGVLEGLEENSYDLLLHDSKSGKISPLDKSRQLVKGRLVDGLLAVAPMVHDTYVYELSQEGIPLVVMGECIHRDEVHRVGIDNAGSSEDVVTRLTALGHRHIAMLTFDNEHMEARLRTAGYRAALEKAGLVVNETLIGVGYYQRHEALEEMRRLIRVHPEITAVFTANIEMALGVRDALRALQLSVPGDVSLVTFDDSEELGLSSPPISAIRQNPYEVGLTAAHMLIDIISSTSGTERLQKVVPTEFIERESIAPPRAEEPMA